MSEIQIQIGAALGTISFVTLIIVGISQEINVRIDKHNKHDKQ